MESKIIKPIESAESSEEAMIPGKELPGFEEHIKKIVLAVSRLNPLVFHNEAYNFCQEIKKKYPYYQKVLCYHALIGSSISEKMGIEHLDFPEPDSVLEFIAKFEEEHIQVQKEKEENK